MADDLFERFKRSAETVSAVVKRVADLEEAFAYAVDLCTRKEACQLLVAGCGEPLSPAAEGLCREKQARVMAAPDLDPDDRQSLERLCGLDGIVLSDRPMREHLAGIDIGLTFADYGIAETGSLVIDSNREAARLATMISEIHVVLLPISRLRASAEAIEPELYDMMNGRGKYLAFITGASRTADIERVLAIGVHGPLELHVLVLEDR